MKRLLDGAFKVAAAATRSGLPIRYLSGCALLGPDSFEGEPALFPQRALHSLLRLWEDAESGAPLRALVAGAAHDAVVANLVREMVEVELIDTIAARIGGVNARKRAGAFCAQIAGLLVTRYILRLEPVASIRSDELIQLYSPPLRLVLTATP